MDSRWSKLVKVLLTTLLVVYGVCQDAMGYAAPPEGYQALSRVAAHQIYNGASCDLNP